MIEMQASEVGESNEKQALLQALEKKQSRKENGTLVKLTKTRDFAHRADWTQVKKVNR